MNCPNCSTDMDHVALAGTYGTEIEVDLCFPCHVIWLDKRESVQLSASGTLELFRMLNEHAEDARHSLRHRTACPRCGQALRLLHDIGKSGRFSYYRCPGGDGRLTPFSEFLKEKQFVRALSPAERQRLAAEVKQVQCSSCGAPVDLQGDFVCGHCGSPLTVLDPTAVERTLRELGEAATEREAVDPVAAELRARALASLETMRTDPDEILGHRNRYRARSAFGVDLVSMSLNAIFGGF
jgi:Zn-finger nucleic acid-binding protein